MKKFTRLPIGLGINHIEQEESIAHHWNECADLGIDPSTPIRISETRSRSFKRANFQTGLSIENTGAAIEEGGKWYLSDATIQKCKDYLK